MHKRPEPDGRRIVRRAALLAAAAVLAACATPVEITSIHEPGGVEPAPLGSLLVVGVSATDSDSRRLEGVFQDRLEAAGVETLAGHRVLDEPGARRTADIRRALERIDAEAVLLLRIVRVDVAAGIDAGRTDIKKTCRRGDPYDLFLYDYEELREPDALTLEHTVVLRSELYRGDDGAVLWGIESTCYRKATLDDALNEQALAVVGQLQEAGWLR
ncbi:MAG: hypothetical protein AAFX58_09220 [Pseudomonadota bacterium]